MPAQILIQLFNQTFQASENTLLVGNADEPLYTPADADHPCHRIYFTRDYASSALHEIAHWTIASHARRQREDYGYWYAPDGRNAQQQAAFEQMEVKPQAIEWIFSLAAGVNFHISADNLDAGHGASAAFKHAVWRQADDYLRHHSLPPRAQLFTTVLLQHFQPGCTLSAAQLRLASL